jgi:predicted permease
MIARPYLKLIRLIGMIVPKRLRSDWRQEWEAELRYLEDRLSRAAKLDWQHRIYLLRRSTAAFHDALVLQPRRLEDQVVQDLRFGFRMLLKSPWVTAVAVLSLAIGIGATTAIFSVINAAMWRPLPAVKDPQELVIFSRTSLNPQHPDPGYGFDYPLYEKLRDQNRSFSGIFSSAGARPSELTVAEAGKSGEIEKVTLCRVTGNFFSVLGVKAVAGRLLTDTDNDPGSPQPVVVISYDFWNRRFNLDPNIAGRKITLDERPFTIVGVSPAGFFGNASPFKPDIWCPLAVTENQSLRNPSASFFNLMGRLGPGADLRRAEAEVGLIFQRHLQEVATRSAGWTPAQRREHFAQRIELESGAVGMNGFKIAFGRQVYTLMIVTSLVLLIACANIANLLLARAAARRKEIAVRLSLGATRLRLIRQLLTESASLAATGGIAGILLSYWFIRILLSTLSTGEIEAAPDLRVLGFALTVSLLTGLIFGIAPALLATRCELADSLKEATRTAAGGSRLKLNRLLIVTQIALSLFLLIGAGLFVRSLRNILQIDTGIDRKNLVNIIIEPGRGSTPTNRVNLYQQLLPQLETIPGVRSATLSSPFPAAEQISIQGYTPAPDLNMTVSRMTVGTRYFETMNIPLIAGRYFDVTDEQPVEAGKKDSPVPLRAVINQSMARHFFGDKNPVGRRFGYNSEDASAIEIIGVVKDAKMAAYLPRDPIPRAFYLNYAQDSARNPVMFLQIRTGDELSGLTEAIERRARELDRRASVAGVITMDELLWGTLRRELFLSRITSFFSLFALLLAGIGIFGITAYAVAERTGEIGIRMALGAEAGDVVRMIMKDTLRLVAFGIVIGLGAALAAARVVENLLYGLEAHDPSTIAAAVALLASTASLAGYLPGRKAAHVDPMKALRNE